MTLNWRSDKLLLLAATLVTLALAAATAQLDAAEEKQDLADVTIVVPASAEVFFNGEPTTQKGGERHYTSPPLVPGKKYYYDVRAKWQDGGKTIEQTRQVEVSAGASSRLDFLIPQAEAVKPPEKVKPIEPIKPMDPVKPTDPIKPIETVKPPKRPAMTAAETAAIAEEAFLYGFPLVMNYGVINEFFIDKTSSQYKAPFNQLHNTANVFTPKDTAVVTPNSDTPYSMIGIDLRAEPFVLSVPDVEKERYYSVQLIDLYTDNFGYIGSRATGNAAGNYLIAGPAWKGETPPGIAKVFHCETEFALAIYRTQLFNPADLDNVKKVQASYGTQPLSAFLKQPAPPAAPEIKWPKLDKKLAETDPFTYLSFLLQFCPATGTAAVEKPLRAKFAKLGIEAGKPFNAAALSQEERDALAAGMKAGLKQIKEHLATFGKDENGWRVGSAFGDRAFYKGDWTRRAAAAMAGIYGNDAIEALYPLLAKDDAGEKPDCAKHKYQLTFAPDQLPPVNAFWSVTMYDGKTQLLIENPLNRYLINSPMLPDLQKNADGSLTLYVQKDSPGKEKESNWLPAPNGPIYLVMRLYWPKEEALKGQWQPSALKRAQE